MAVALSGFESAVKTAAGVFSDGGSVDLPSPNRGAVTEACYPIPLQICSKGLERQQLASGISENWHGRDRATGRGHIPATTANSPTSPSCLCLNIYCGEEC